MQGFKLPGNLLLGTATASLQIEGGDRNNTWYRWAELGKIKDGSHCIIADDHWNRVIEDIELMKKMNCKVYRMGVEWSRIEPEKGKYNKEAIEHYRWEVEKLLEAGIKPLITLHHFSNPIWFEDSGGWLNSDSIFIFEKYTEFVVKNLGDLVSEWVTINEPNIYLMMGYVFGIWPPGKKSAKLYLQCAKNIIAAHIFSYNKIHSIRKTLAKNDTMVGVANHILVYDSKNKILLEDYICKIYDILFHEIFISGMSEGKYIFPIGFNNYPYGKGNYMDFFGVNYYTRNLVSFSLNPSMIFGKLETNENAEKNDLGWEIYPEGLYRICKKYFNRFKKPIYITENGTCDANDKFRAKYIYDHLYQLKRLTDEGIDIRRYYHWTLMDNFEWVEGLSARFGLIKVNFDTQERIIRKSGEFYGAICKNNEITKEMIDIYLK